MVSSLIEILELPNFGLQYYLNYVIKFCWWSCGQNLSQHKLLLFQNNFILRGLSVANFADIIKIATAYLNNL